MEQIQHSVIEIQELDLEGHVAAAHKHKTAMRRTHKNEMELPLRLAGFLRWQICGDLYRRPLTSERDLMVVFAGRD